MNVNKKQLNAEIRNSLFTDTERFEMFFAAHWKKIMAVAIAVVIAVTAAFALWGAYRASQRRIAFELADANTIAELQGAISRAGSHPGVAAASYRLALLAIDGKDYSLALATLDSLGKKNASPALQERARLLAASVVELQGDRKGAAERYDLVAADPGCSSAIRAEAACASARIAAQSGDQAAAANALKVLGGLPANDYTVQGYQQAGRQLAIALENGEIKAK